MNALLFVVFWAMQVFAALAFKFGSTSDARWLPSFAVGNVVAMGSIWLMMRLYRSMHPNVVLGVAFGGAFLLGQIAMVVFFGSRLSVTQMAGLAAMITGITALALGGRERNAAG